jgi:hypothetical protein
MKLAPCQSCKRSMGNWSLTPHVHTLVTAGDLRAAGSQGASSIYFDPYELMRSWKRLVIVLLRGALEAGQLKSGMSILCC